jgi:hypothetical protein
VICTSESLKESLKELGRILVLAALPILIDSLSSGQFSWRVLMVAVATAGLRFIDKYLHLEEPEGVSGGLTRF